MSHIQIILAFFLFFLFLPLNSFSIETELNDDFNYTSISEMKENGWIIYNEKLVSLNESYVILKNTCQEESHLRHLLPPSYSFVTSSIGKWIDGPYGSLHLLLFSNSTYYAWWRDGYSENLFFEINKSVIFAKKVGIKKGIFYNLTIFSNGTHWKLYFNNTLYYVYPIRDSITRIGINSAFCSITAYDKIFFKKLDTYSISIFPQSSLLITSLNYIPVLISVNHLFPEDIDIHLLEIYLNYSNFTGQIIQVESNLPIENSISVDLETFIKSYYKTNYSIVCSSRDKVTCLYANLLASYLNLPYFENKPQFGFRAKYNITSKDQAMEILFNHLKSNNKNIRAIIVTNLNSSKVYFANHISPFLNAFPIYLNLTNIENKTFFVREKIVETVNFLDERGFLFNSREYREGKMIPSIIIIGNESEIPFFKLKDPTPKISLNYFLGYYDDYILTDSPYCNFNLSANFEDKTIFIQHAICSRLFANLSFLFYQFEIEKVRMPKNVTIINDYSVPENMQFLGFGNIEEGFWLYYSLKKQGLRVKRFIERRSPLNEISSNEIANLTEYLIGEYFSNKIKDIIEKGGLKKILGVFSLIKDYFTVLSFLFEYDWENGIKRFIESDFTNFKIEKFPEFDESYLNFPVIIYLANSTRNGEEWYFANQSINWKNYSFIFVFNSHIRSFNLNNTTSKQLTKNGKIPILSFTSRMPPGYFASFTRKMLSNISFPLGYSFYKAKNYMLAINYFVNKHARKWMQEYYKLSLSSLYSSSPLLSFVDKPIIPRETIMPKKKEDKFTLPFIKEPECLFFNFKNKTYIVCSEYYIKVEGFPIIPIFEKEFRLPTNSKIENISFNYETIKVENVFVPIYGNYSNFTKFPLDFVSSYEFKSIKNETILKVLYSPIIYFSNGTALYLKKLEVEVTYSLPLEIYGIKFSNTTEKKNVRMHLKIFSKQNEKANLTITIENKTIEYKINLNEGANYFSFNLGSFEAKNYSVSLLLYDGKNFVRKSTILEITKEKEEKGLFSIFYEIFSPIIHFFTKSYEDRKIVVKEKEGCIKYLLAANYSLEIEKCGDKLEINYSDTKMKYKLVSSPFSRIESINSINGYLIVNQSLGIREECYGKCKELEKELKDAREKIVEITFENELTW